jgi:hypothetical protein
MLCCYDCIVAIGVKLWPELFQTWQDSLFDIVAAEVLYLLAANKRHCMLDFLRASFGYSCATSSQTMQWRVSVRTQPGNIAIARMNFVLKPAL